MWQRASVKDARSRIATELRRAATHITARHVKVVLGRVVAVLFCLQLFYLAIGNAVVKSRLIRDAVSASEGFSLEYEDAYTLWPGHAHVRDLSLTVEDYNVQFEVALASATVDISLSELPFKKFHITKLEGEGTRFRMRHKLIAVGEDAERVAAYPPIRGFSDPPYYKGIRSPSTPEGEYDLWSLRIENVTARVSELWVLEQHFAGKGVARGSFVVKPERWVQVEPAELTLETGTLKLGEHVVAANVRGKITCDIPDMDVQASEGVQVLNDISATIRLTLERGQLDFLQAYLRRYGGVGYSGAGDWLVDLNVQRGVVQKGSHVRLTAAPLRVAHDDLSLEGPLELELARSGTEWPDQLQLSWHSPELVAARDGKRDRAPRVTGLRGSLLLNAVDLKGELSLGAAKVAVSRIDAPWLGWLRVPDTELAGAGNADFALARSQTGRVSGSARLELADLSLKRGSFGVSGDLKSDLQMAREAAPSAPLQLGQMNVSMRRAMIRDGERSTKPFSARLDADGLQVLLAGEPSARGAVRLHVSSTEALLPLVTSDPGKGVTSALLDLRALNAKAQLEVAGGGVALTGVEATGGNLHLHGHFAKRGKDPRGAFVLSSGMLNVGVELLHGETSISPLVGDDWLTTTALRD